jgi:osmotically-inducible protein OsmY
VTRAVFRPCPAPRSGAFAAARGADCHTGHDRHVVARSTSGVKDVVSLLKVGLEPAASAAGTDVKGEQLLDTDPAIAIQARMLLAIDPDVEPPRVKVSVDRGVVELTGTVDPIARDRALEVAKSVHGVKRVEDHLTVH